MPDLYEQEYIQERNNKCVPVVKVNRAYGDKFLIDTSPSYQPYLGASETVHRLQQYQPRVCYTFCNTPAVNLENFVILKRDRPEKINPFTQMDVLDSEEEQLQELILQLRASQSIPYRESLANRLFTLFREAKEEDSASVGITVGSLRNFYNFFQMHLTLKCPIISLTPEYNIYSTWKKEKNRVFSIHFLPTGDVRFVIFKPNEKHPERQIRISGTATADILMKTVAPYDVQDWIAE